MSLVSYQNDHFALFVLYVVIKTITLLCSFCMST